MAGKSTLKDVGLDMQDTNTSDVYNLQNWQGLTDVLKVAKEALTDTSEYAAFRNLVLQYAQQGGDIEIKKKILAQIEQFSKPKKETYHSDFLPHSLTSSVDHIEPVPDVSQEVTETDQKQQENNNDQAADVPVPSLHAGVVGTRRMTPRFVKLTPVSLPVEEAPIVPEEEKVIVPQSFLPESIVVDEVVPEPEPEPLPKVLPQAEEVSVSPAVHHSIESYKTRITEIKHLVHNHLGNPAAIIDMRSVVGKTYMKALLTALKATSPGSDANADIAMSELEVAFESLISESESATPKPSVTAPEVFVPADIPEAVAPVHVAEVVPEEESTFEDSEIISPTEEGVVEETEQELPEVEDEIDTVLPHAEIPVYKAPEIVQEVTQEIVPEIESKYSVKNTLAELSLIAKQQRNEIPSTNQQSVIHADATISSRVSPEQTKYSLRGIGKVTDDQNTTAPTSDPKEVVVMQAELVSEEITTSLHSLLHDWVIFAGSGFFGTGPSGVEHPLYRKLSVLSMGEVVAGRWENSDPKITKTIKEYVDAWRHEQGIAYTTNETFEHYLRRVIQRILKRQSQKV